MWKRKLLCIECGMPLTEKEGEELKSMLCAKCRERSLKEKKEMIILPQKLSLTLCRKCGAYKRGKVWHPPQSQEESICSEVVSSIVPVKGVNLRNVIVEPKQISEKEYKCGVLVEVEDESDSEAEREYFTHVHIHYQVCEVCSRKYGNYFEAILQIRRDRELSPAQLRNLRKEIEEFVEKESQRDWHSFFTKVVEIHGGLDFYLSPSSLAQKLCSFLAERHGGEIKTSSSLVGRKDGRNVYRVTHCLRLPTMEEGDVVQFISKEKKVFLVRKLTRRGARLINLFTHKEEFVSSRFFKDLKINTRKKIRYEAIVLFEEEKELKIMDPENYKPVTLLKPYPSFKVAAGKTVSVLKTDFGIFLDVVNVEEEEGL